MEHQIEDSSSTNSKNRYGIRNNFLMIHFYLYGNILNVAPPIPSSTGLRLDGPPKTLQSMFDTCLASAFGVLDDLLQQS